LGNNENIEKLNLILEGGAELFRKFGIRSISMDDVARELGISKKTLYQYVDSKADLLKKVFFKRQQEFVATIDKLKAKNLNAIDELLEVSIMVSDEIKRFNPSNVFDMQKYYPEVFSEHIQTEKQYTHEMILENLKKGIRQGLYREGQDIGLVAGLYIQKIENVHDENFLNQICFSMEKIFEVMFENHIRGISNPEGIAYFEERKQQLKFE
jgi:TetR/AcrR family transcriptional regulator, cholesterol catabolism regulator